MKRLTRRQLDELLASGRASVTECDEVLELDGALAIAQACVTHGRAIPTNVIMRCIAHARHWKARDIPTVIVEARKTWLRMRETKQLTERVQ